MNLSPLARWYRWIEYIAFGRALERRRFAFLDRLANARRILMVGEGDGRALERLLALAPQARIDVVELSGKMIELARRRAGDSSRVGFQQRDALTASWPENHYDGLLTLFFLDCFDEAETRDLIQRLAKTMVGGGIWLVSEFAIPERGWRRRHARMWIWMMYRFFGVTTGLRARALPPVERLLNEAGLQRLELEEERWGLIRSEVWSKR